MIDGADVSVPATDTKPPRKDQQMPPHDRRHQNHPSPHHHEAPNRHRLGKRPGHRPPHLHHDRLIDALGHLIEAALVRDVEDTIRAVEKMPRGANLAIFLREHCADLPLDRALAKATLYSCDQSFHIEEQTRVAAASGKSAVILPVPPHVTDLLYDAAELVLLMVDLDHLPPHLRDLRHARRIEGTPKSRAFLADADLVVFEVAEEEGKFYARDAVVDLIDDRVLKPGAVTVAHVRPHVHRDDLPLLSTNHPLLIGV